MKKLFLSGMANILLFATLLVPGMASAQVLILDSGTPTSNTFPVVSNSSWFAGEFSATQGETVTQLSAYIYSMSGNGSNLVYDIYTDNNGAFLGARSSNLNADLEVSTTATFTTTGWTSSSLHWTVPTTGNYWFAVEDNATGTHNLPTYDLQQETSATTGTVPALEFAHYSSPSFTASNSTPIGLQVTATPEPSTWALLLAGLGLLAFWRLRSARRMCQRSRLPKLAKSL